ncbi:MAG: hypothetical protein H0W08_16375 [Acidobacteria bacterium]|nr:hypothetical protein [Acidobacteriota bacterium]
MKSLFKLVVFIVLANALVRFAIPYWHHHEFESALKARVLDWRESGDEAILQEVFALAAENHVPILPDHVGLRRESDRLLLDIAYTLPIEFFPTVARPWEFAVNLSGRVVRAPGSPR